MNALNIPGFTAEASLEKMAVYRMTRAYSSQDVAQSVEPAMRRSCAILDRLFVNSVVYGDEAGKAFFLGAMVGAGCFG